MARTYATRYGKVINLEEKIVNGVKRVEAEVEYELGITDFVWVVANKAVEWQPEIDEQVVIHYDEKNNGILVATYVENMVNPDPNSPDHNYILRNYRGENILEFKDLDNNIVGNRVDKNGYIGDIIPDLLAPVHVSEVRSPVVHIDVPAGGPVGPPVVASVPITVGGVTYLLALY